MFLASKLKRPSALAGAALLLLVSFVPLLSQQKAGAYGLLTSREIRMSNSAASATDVTYLVRSTTPSTETIGSMAVQFCDNSPIIGDSCNAPAGLDVSSATLALANQTGVTDWTVDTTNSTANTLVLTRSGGPASFTAGTFTLELGSTGGTDGIDNPTAANATFYARILTFADDDDDTDGCSTADDSATCYPTTAIANNSLHAGGVAMSTAAEITVTAKVQERLTFCVYTDGNNDSTLGDANFTSCTGVGGTAITLGDTNGVLSDAGEFVDKNTMYNIATNASNGATVRVKGATLTSGSFTIDGMGAAANDSTPGTEEFGFCNYRDSGGGTAGLTPSSPYDHAQCSATTQTAGTGATGGAGTAQFAFDTVTACNTTAGAVDFESTSLACRYGDAIATKTAGNMSTGRVVFIGNIATTTEPGIYTSTLNFIATGNY